MGQLIFVFQFPMLKHGAIDFVLLPMLKHGAVEFEFLKSIERCLGTALRTGDQNRQAKPENKPKEYGR